MLKTTYLEYTILKPRYGNVMYTNGTITGMADRISEAINRIDKLTQL